VSEIKKKYEHLKYAKKYYQFIEDILFFSKKFDNGHSMYYLMKDTRMFVIDYEPITILKLTCYDDSYVMMRFKKIDIINFCGNQKLTLMFYEFIKDIEIVCFINNDYNELFV